MEREVNEGKYFAPLRQMYNSLILAIWFKKRYKENLIGQVYVDRKKTSGIAVEEKQIKEKIYAQYLKAFKRGVYNYIKEESDPMTGQAIPRKYFSGGFSFADAAMKVTYLPAAGLGGIRDRIGSFKKGLYRFTVALNPLGISKAKLIALMAGGSILMGAVQQANAAVPVTPLPDLGKNVYVIKEPAQSGYAYRQALKDLQKALNKVDGNTSSILGDHPGAVGYERLKGLVDAIDGLPANAPVKAQALQLKKAMLDGQFFKDNLGASSQGIPKGAYLLTHPVQ